LEAAGQNNPPTAEAHEATAAKKTIAPDVPVTHLYIEPLHTDTFILDFLRRQHRIAIVKNPLHARQAPPSFQYPVPLGHTCGESFRQGHHEEHCRLTLRSFEL
jgi:hypothetical protein